MTKHMEGLASAIDAQMSRANFSEYDPEQQIIIWLDVPGGRENAISVIGSARQKRVSQAPQTARYHMARGGVAVGFGVWGGS
jgi:hypothetical protein